MYSCIRFMNTWMCKFNKKQHFEQKAEKIHKDHFQQPPQSMCSPIPLPALTFPSVMLGCYTHDIHMFTYATYVSVSSSPVFWSEDSLSEIL